MSELPSAYRVDRGSRRRPMLLALLIIAIVGFWQWRRAETPRDNTNDAPIEAAPTAGRSATTAPAPTTPPATTSRDLSVDEARGGHTLARHVGKTDAALRERLTREPGISAASSYTDRAIAEATVGRALSEQSARVGEWAGRQGNRPNLALSYRGPRSEIIGRTLPRNRRDAIPSTDAVVVLRWDGRTFYVLTSYPEVRR